MTNAAMTTQCNPLFRVAFVGANVWLEISTIAILGSEIRDISEPSCGNSETEGKAATGSGERARVASKFQIRGSESVDSCLLVSIRG